MSNRHSSYSQPWEGPGTTLSPLCALAPPLTVPIPSQRRSCKEGHLTAEAIEEQGGDGTCQGGAAKVTDLECEHGPSCSMLRELGHPARVPVQAERHDVGKSLLSLEGFGLHCGCSLVGKAGQRALRLTLQAGPEQRGPWVVLVWGVGVLVQMESCWGF